MIEHFVIGWLSFALYLAIGVLVCGACGDDLQPISPGVAMVCLVFWPVWAIYWGVSLVSAGTIRLALWMRCRVFGRHEFRFINAFLGYRTCRKCQKRFSIYT